MEGPENKNKIQLLLIGKTGHGKSSLGNFLLGQKDLFKVFHNPKSGTQDPSKHERNGLTIIDSPGLLDSENDANKNMDAEHYEKLVYFIKSQAELNGIIIVMNSQEDRFSEDIQTMLKMICNTFEYKHFKFISFVFTKFYGKKKVLEQIRKNKEEFVMQTKELIKKFYGQDELPGTLPYFFIDSDLDDEPDKDSLKAREEILNWAIGLPPFNPKELEAKDPRYKNMKEEYDNEIITTEDSDYIYKETIVYKFKTAIDLNGNKVQIGSKEEVRRVKNKFPKHESFWTKLVGGAMIGIGILAAPFSAGASLVGVGGGIATIASS